MICYPETTAATEESLDQRHIIARILEVCMNEEKWNDLKVFCMIYTRFINRIPNILSLTSLLHRFLFHRYFSVIIISLSFLFCQEHNTDLVARVVYLVW